MPVRNLLFSFLCLSSLTAIAQTNYPTGARSCVARYDFSTTTNSGTQLVDVSGNAHTGTIYNATPTTGWRGRANTALQFDGQSSYVQVAHTPLLAPQAITMVGLVRFDGFYSGTCQGNAIVEKGYPWRNSGTYALFCSDQAYDNDCNTFSPQHQSSGVDLGYVNYYASATPPALQAGQWYFVAASFNGASVSLYQQMMDSTAGTPPSLSPIYTVASQGAIGSNTLDVLIGRTLNPPYPYWFNGAMDEVAIFNRGLSREEITGIYQYLWGQSMGIKTPVLSDDGLRTHTENGSLYVQSADGDAIGALSLYNMSGQALLTGDYKEPKATIDVSAYPRELLFIKVARKGTVVILKTSNL